MRLQPPHGEAGHFVRSVGAGQLDPLPGVRAESRAEGVPVAAIEQRRRLERLSVLIEHGLGQLEEGGPARDVEEPRCVGVGCDGAEHHVGPARDDARSAPKRGVERLGSEIHPVEDLRQPCVEDRPVERERRAVEQADPLELENRSSGSDPQPHCFDVERGTKPARTHDGTDSDPMAVCPLGQALRSFDPFRQGCGHDPAAATLRRDQAAPLEVREGPPQGGAGDAQSGAQVALGCQTLAVCEPAGQDVRLESAQHLDVREVVPPEVDPTSWPGTGRDPRHLLTLVHLWFSLTAVKLALLGGGGFRTPVIYRAIASGATRVQYDELALYDVDSSRLERIEGVLRGIDDRLGGHVPHHSTTSLEEAVDGADVVYCAVRVGGIAGRLIDETVAIHRGAIGQETAGAGGIAFALRTVPVVTEIAQVVDRRAPDALFINFTNPVGLVTEAIRRVLGDRVVGICDAPEDLCRRVAAVLGRRPEELWFDYFGINHLGWLRGVLDHNRDLLIGLLDDPERIESMQEGRLFGADWIRSLGMIPNEYLYYFYFEREALAAMRAGHVRAAYLREQQNAFYGGDGGPGEALGTWERLLSEREAHYMEEAWSGREAAHEAVADRQPGGYGGLALGLVDALHSDEPHVRILDVANRSSLPFLDPDAIVEVPCVVGSGGVVPVAIGSVPIEAQGLILQVRAAERAAIDAALSGSRRQAIRALALHPLVPSVEAATEILDGYVHRHPELQGAIR